MEFKNLHPWNVNHKEAIQIQQRLQKELILKKPKHRFYLAAGTDVAYDKKSDKFYAGVIIFNLVDMQKVEQATAIGRVRFPYIPGLLSFREAPILLKAFSKIKQKPDILIVDGQGIAHPRGFGLASHLGLILDVPSIGCAKSRLIGEHEPVGEKAGSQSYIKINDKIIGVVLRTRTNVKPVYVSPGHKIDLASAIDVVLKCCRGYKLPEPTRQAHNLVNKLKGKKVKRLKGEKVNFSLSLLASLPFYLLPIYVNANSMTETLYLIPVGHVQYSLMERLAKSLEERFNISCKINKEFQVPPEAYDRKRDQYHSSLILKRLKSLPLQADNALKLGVTEHDLYVPSLNFVFGEASPGDGIAIISLQRLRQEFYGLKEDEEKLRLRLVTEAVHELGHVFGLMHCSNPKCVMFFSNTLADTDRKSDKLCEKCLPILKKR